MPNVWETYFTKIFHNHSYPAISPTRPELSAAGKTVVISGGGRGIGTGVVEAFAQAGASHIVVTGRNAASLQTVAARIKGSYPNTKVSVVTGDVSSEADVARAFAALTQVDVVVANAAHLAGVRAVSPAPASAERNDSLDAFVEDWWRSYEVNVKGVLLLARQFLAHAAPVCINTRPLDREPPIRMQYLIRDRRLLIGGSQDAQSKPLSVRNTAESVHNDLFVTTDESRAHFMTFNDAGRKRKKVPGTVLGDAWSSGGLFNIVKAPGGVFINVSAGGVHCGPPGISAYGGSKLAAVRLVETLQVENPALRFYSIHPGVVKTDMLIQSGFDALNPPLDDIDLPGNFMVWLASPEGEFLKGRFLWVNWDVEELMAKKDDILSGNKLVTGLLGWE